MSGSPDDQLSGVYQTGESGDPVVGIIAAVGRVDRLELGLERSND